MFFIPGWIIATLTFPGVMLHEWAHKKFCEWTGVKVLEVCYFRVGNPAGYVVHRKTKTFKQSFFITVGPFIINSLLASVLSLIGAFLLTYSAHNHVLGTILLWVAFSAGAHAFPSGIDAKNLWEESKEYAKDNPLIYLVYPLILLIYAANFLSVVWFDFVYALAIVAVSQYISYIIAQWAKDTIQPIISIITPLGQGMDILLCLMVWGVVFFYGARACYLRWVKGGIKNKVVSIALLLFMLLFVVNTGFMEILGAYPSTTSKGTSQPTVESRYNTSAMELRIYGDINKAREEEWWLPGLEWNEGLAAVAREHSANLAKENEPLTNTQKACQYPFVHDEGFDFGLYVPDRLRNRNISNFGWVADMSMVDTVYDSKEYMRSSREPEISCEDTDNLVYYISWMYKINNTGPGFVKVDFNRRRTQERGEKYMTWTKTIWNSQEEVMGNVSDVIAYNDDIYNGNATDVGVGVTISNEHVFVNVILAEMHTPIDHTAEEAQHTVIYTEEQLLGSANNQDEEMLLPSFDYEDSKFSPGQVWAYRTRPGEESSNLTILKVEKYPEQGIVAHIRVHGIRLNLGDVILPVFAQTVVSRSTLENSVTELIGHREPKLIVSEYNGDRQGILSGSFNVSRWADIVNLLDLAER